MDSTTPHIDIINKMPGVDPLTAMLAGNRGGGDGLFGGSGGGLLPLLIGAFLFGGGRGMWGLGGGAGAAGAVAAAEGITTAKDVSAQLNTFQSWAQTNSQALSTQLCTSSANIVNTVNGVSDKLFQTFVAQAQAQTAQLNDIGREFTDQINTQTQTLLNGFNAVRDAQGAILGQMATGFAAGALAECQTQNLINATKADSDFKTASQFCSLSKQLAECCCENRLAIANQNALIERNTAALQNQLNAQTCEIKQAISADGQATRALIQANETERLRSELADAKVQISQSVQTAALIEALGKKNGSDK